ncbi:MAG: hypothetical protein OEO19_12180 [Gammaproteobacteria bacterium]|nr:hypothetical protein [Gammaproteobacteria bacterium]MDH3449639.1 hypothetical protein [Gammaproteobacteria bacterium]
MLILLEKHFRNLFILSLLSASALYFVKDDLPPASFYDLEELHEPIQQPTRRDSFMTGVKGESYLVKPLYDYELEGVVVSYHDADDFTDIWHHHRWKDFINLRDLCVIWGSNVETGVYLDMEFHNDSWTCWFSWPNAEVGRRFQQTQISNNHVLIDDDTVKAKLMSSEPGDHIRLKGMLAEYSNPNSGFFRSTSTIRNDTGNGACETIFVTDFEIVRKANRQLRLYYSIAKWTAFVSLAGVAILFFVAPYQRRHA